MRTLSLGLLALATLALASPAAAEEATPLSRQAQRGKEMYQKYCAACHGLNGTGDGIVAESLKTLPPNLTKIAARREGVFNATEIKTIIDGRILEKVHGIRDMPVWGEALGAGPGRPPVKEQRAENRIEALVAYLQSIQKP